MISIRKCLFPAAGYGTRFLPATKSVPKEMLPVVNKPLIHYGVEEAMEAGIEEMCVITGRNKEAISNYFDISYEIENKIAGSNKEKLLLPIRHILDKSIFTYVRQKEMRGLGDAVLTGRPLIGSEAFAVLLADDLCLHPDGDGILLQMKKLFEKYQCTIVAVQKVADTEVSNYGMVTGETIDMKLTRVTSMIEKPAIGTVDTNLAIIGRYILTPDIFDILSGLHTGSGNEIQITDAINEQAKQKMVLAYEFNGIRFDCGKITGMVNAINHVYGNIYS